MQGALKSSVRLLHTARTIIFSNYGAPKEVLQVLKHKLPEPGLGEATLKLIAAPINPSDINQIEGTYASKPEFSKRFGSSDAVAVPGNEGVFEVIGLGESQTGIDRERNSKDVLNTSLNTLEVGDWVIPKKASFGTWTTFKNAKISDLISLGKPNGLTPLQAATIAVNPLTAYRMLKDFAELEKGDWFIQNGSNSGVGRMAIQLAKLWGIKSINVVRDRRDIDELKQELHDLGADHVLTEEQVADRSSKTVISDWTNGAMCKLALNCVGGRSSTNIAKQLTDQGVIVTYGGMSKQPVGIPTSLYIFKDIHSRGFWVTKWKNNNPEEFEQMIQKVASMFRAKELEVTAINTVEFQNLENAPSEEFLSLFKSSNAKSVKYVIVAN